MRVIILGTAWPYRGGLSAFNERLAYEYMTRGDEVEIVTWTLQYPSFLFPGKTQYSDEPAPRELKITRMLNAINPFSWIKTGRYIKRQKPDLLITKFWLPFMAPALGTVNRVAKRDGLRRIAILDNLVPHEKRIGDGMLARYFVKSIDGMVAMSQSVLDDADLFDPKRHKARRLCPHPLYDHYGETLPKAKAREKIGIDREGRYALFFGFIRDYKGLDLLLDAMGDARLARMGVKPRDSGTRDTEDGLHTGQRGEPLLLRSGRGGAALQIGDAERSNTDCLPVREADDSDARGRPARDRAA